MYTNNNKGKKISVGNLLFMKSEDARKRVNEYTFLKKHLISF